MTSAKPSATLGFVDRVEEMKRILDALNVASEGKGQLLLVRGEAGSGKTRLLQEGATEAEKQGFTIGFGTALAESVVPYHAWKEVLEGLGLETILEEAPPPKLLGLYLIASDGGIRIKVEREGTDTRLAPLVDMIAESVRKSESQQVNDEEETISHDHYRSVVERRPNSSLGAIVEGQEDEAFLADMMALADKAESIFSGEDILHNGEEPHEAMKAHMQQLLDSEIYEGIDYAKENPKLRQNRLFEHITLGLSRKAGSHPICVVIDDLQWADPSSLALLHYAARNIRKTGVLLLCTYRVEEADVRPHLRDALKGMEQEEILAEMDLNGLTREDLPDLAESFIGSHALPAAFLDLLWQETQGYPLFVREVLRGLEEDSALEVRVGLKSLVRPPDQLALPERVREVICARLDRLPKAERRLLDAAATCGTRFTAAFVAKVAEEGEAKVLNGLSAIAKVHGLLRLTENEFAFDHPAVKEAIYDDVPPEIRQTYHKEAAEWLELVGGPVEDIGEHYYRARDHRAVAVLSEAASVARTRYANEEAIRFYTEALEFEVDAQKRREILENLGSVYALVGDLEKGLESYEGALELAEGRRMRAGTLANVGRLHILRGEYEESARVCTDALSLVGGDASEEEALALRNFGSSHFCKGDYDAALGCYAKALAIDEEIGNQIGVAGTLNNIGMIHREKGNGDQALECFNRSVEISEEIGHQVYLANHLGNLGVVYFDSGDYIKALDYHRRSLAIREKIGDQLGFSHSLSNIGVVYDYRGDYDEALEYHRKAQSIASKIGDQEGTVTNLLNIGRVHRERRDHEKALEYLEKSIEMAEKMGLQSALLEAYCEVAEAHFERGDLKEALETSNKAFSLASDLGQKRQIADSRRIIGMVYRERRMWNKSTENFEESVKILKEIGMGKELGDSYYEFGLMWKGKRDTAKARQNLGRAVRIFGKTNLEKDLKKAREALKDI